MLLSELRPKLLKTLKNSKFVEDISTLSSLRIQENKNKDSECNELFCVEIENFSSLSTKAWRINLESNIDGLPRRQGEKVTEIAIIIAKKKCLDICLIEMKSTMSPKLLKATKDKFKDVANRCYFLLMLNSTENHGEFINHEINFKGFVFYNGTPDKPILDKNGKACYEDIKDVFNGNSKNISLKLVLGTQSIPVKFICDNFENGEIKINANDLFCS